MHVSARIALIATLFFASVAAFSQDVPAVPTTETAPQSTQAPPPLVPPLTGKKSKDVYTGPTAVVELTPTPMLDEEGKQRVDIDGKPLFNKPIYQQRDRKGHPLFDEKGKPVFQTATELGYDEHGKKLIEEKVKPPKTTAVSIDHGVLTVDGLTGKAALNYEIADLKFIYLYAPWIGTAVVSNVAFPGAKEQPGAFEDKTLTVVLGEHTFQLYSDKRMLGKKPESAYVVLDRDFRLPSKNPEVGYGSTARAPYAWPGAKAARPQKGAAANAPPIPANLRPTQLLSPCPSGQMRMAGPPALPGQTAPVPPCVPIAQAAQAPRATPPASSPQPQ